MQIESGAEAKESSRSAKERTNERTNERSEGRAREYVLRAVEMQSSFHYMWDTFCRLFQETVDPEVGQRQLLNLREKRPTDLSTHLQDILKYAAQASYAFSPETRPSFIIRATRQEMDILLTRYYPFGKKDIQNKEAAIRYNWMTERARLRRQVPPKNPDVYQKKKDKESKAKKD